MRLTYHESTGEYHVSTADIGKGLKDRNLTVSGSAARRLREQLFWAQPDAAPCPQSLPAQVTGEWFTRGQHFLRMYRGLLLIANASTFSCAVIDPVTGAMLREGIGVNFRATSERFADEWLTAHEQQPEPAPGFVCHEWKESPRANEKQCWWYRYQDSEWQLLPSRARYCLTCGADLRSDGVSVPRPRPENADHKPYTLRTTNDQREALVQVEQQGTPGIWIAHEGHIHEDASGRERGVATCRNQSGSTITAEKDAHLIAAARNALPDLLADIATLEEQVEWERVERAWLQDAYSEKLDDLIEAEHELAEARKADPAAEARKMLVIALSDKLLDILDTHSPREGHEWRIWLRQTGQDGQKHFDGDTESAALIAAAEWVEANLRKEPESALPLTVQDCDEELRERGYKPLQTGTGVVYARGQQIKAEDRTKSPNEQYRSMVAQARQLDAAGGDE